MVIAVHVAAVMIAGAVIILLTLSPRDPSFLPLLLLLLLRLHASTSSSSPPSSPTLSTFVREATTSSKRRHLQHHYCHRRRPTGRRPLVFATSRRSSFSLSLTLFLFHAECGAARVLCVPCVHACVRACVRASVCLSVRSTELTDCSAA